MLFFSPVSRPSSGSLWLRYSRSVLGWFIPACTLALRSVFDRLGQRIVIFSSGNAPGGMNQSPKKLACRCEERSDEATPSFQGGCFAEYSSQRHKLARAPRPRSSVSLRPSPVPDPPSPAPGPASPSGSWNRSTGGRTHRSRPGPSGPRRCRRRYNKYAILATLKAPMDHTPQARLQTPKISMLRHSDISGRAGVRLHSWYVRFPTLGFSRLPVGIR